MRNILLFGATGQLGKRIVEKLSHEDWSLYAFVRPSSDIQQLKDIGANLIYGDVSNHADVAKAFSTEFELVISTIGASGDNLKTISQGTTNIVQHFKAKKFIAVGGAGILPDLEYGQQFQHPAFPSFLKPIANEHWNAYLKVANSAINYLYVCPPRMVPGSFNDSYEILIEEAIKSPGAAVSFEACATYITKEAQKTELMNQRIGIFNI